MSRSSSASLRRQVTIAHLCIFACLLESRSRSVMIRLGYFDSICEYCVSFVASQHSHVAVVIDLCIVKLLKVCPELFGDSGSYSSQTCGIVCESSLARAILNDDSTDQCLIILGTDIGVIVTILHFNCALCDWRSCSDTRSSCSTWCC